MLPFDLLTDLSMVADGRVCRSLPQTCFIFHHNFVFLVIALGISLAAQRQPDALQPVTIFDASSVAEPGLFSELHAEQ